MAFCPPELLDDLAGLFADLRTWAGVIEKKPGVFYVRTQPFLHFHLLAGGRRRADVKGRAKWVQLDLPRPVTATRQRTLFRELRMRYGERAETKTAVRRRSPAATALRAAAPPGDGWNAGSPGGASPRDRSTTVAGPSGPARRVRGTGRIS